MTCYLLDTNVVTAFLKGHPRVDEKMKSTPASALGVSVITEAELLFGLAKKPGAIALHRLVLEFLDRVEAFPWRSQEAQRHAVLRAELESRGIVIGPLDLLIAVQALEMGATLVTGDKALLQIDALTVEDWTA